MLERHQDSLLIGMRNKLPTGRGARTYLADILASSSFWAPLRTGINAQGGSPTPTFTRATTATVIDHDDMVRNVLSGEARFQGARRVYNVRDATRALISTETLTAANGMGTHNFGTGIVPTITGGQTLTYNGQSYTATRFEFSLNGGTTTNDRSFINVNSDSTKSRVFSIIAKSNTTDNYVMNLRVGGGSTQITVTPTAQRFGVAATGDSDTTCWFGLRGGMSPTNSNTADILVTAWQLEETDGQSVQVPSEYVSVGVASAPYHGANVDGVKYFDRHNGNVVQQNLVLQSQTFQTSWSPGQATVSADQTTAPDGTLTADLIYENTANSVHALDSATIAASLSAYRVYTTSVYAKAGTRSWIRLNLLGGANGIYANFNLGTGAVGSTGISGTGDSIISAKIENAGNGWYRCSLTGILGTITSTLVRINLATADNTITYVGDGTSGAYIWGAQVQPGYYASTYVATTTLAVNNAIVESNDGPQIAESDLLGYLAEAFRTNVNIRSEEFDNAAWTKTDTTVTANSGVSPDGATTAELLTEGVAGTAAVVGTAGTVAAGATVTASIWFKRSAVIQWIFIRTGNAAGTNGARGWFDIQNGVKGSTALLGTGTNASSTITAYPNGWYRCTLTVTMDAADTSTSIAFASGNADLSAVRVNNSAYYAWGAQLEAASFASSYIPTTTASVARNADVLTYNQTPPQTEGSLYVEMTISSVDVNAHPGVCVNDGGGNEYIYLGGVSTSRLVVADGGVNQVNLSGTNFSANTIFKTAARFAANDFAISKDGGAVSTDTAGTLPTTTRIEIGGLANSNQPYGTVKNARIWSRKLPDAILQALTT